MRDFFTELKKLQKPSDLSLYSTKPDFVALARSLNALVAEPLLAPDGSTIYDPQLLRSTPADQRRSYHLANQVFAFWNAAKRGHESRALFRAEGAVLEEVEGYLQPEAREIELGVGTHQERFGESSVYPSSRFSLLMPFHFVFLRRAALPSPAGASRPAPVRSGTLSAAERTASQDLGAPLCFLFAHPASLTYESFPFSSPKGRHARPQESGTAAELSSVYQGWQGARLGRGEAGNKDIQLQRTREAAVLSESRRRETLGYSR